MTKNSWKINQIIKNLKYTINNYLHISAFKRITYTTRIYSAIALP